MENLNYELMSNKELTDKESELTQTFEIAQTKLKDNYLVMVQASEEIAKIKEILDKRGGKK